MAALPLAGIRVADFSRVVAGPYCAMLLGDLGAEVIKVERPHGGDDTRAWGPPYLGGESAYYLSLNRNKRSLLLDLKDARDLELARRLIKRSDVMLHNFVPGAAERLGLGYEAVQGLNPRLIYTHISGYGSSGPEAERPAYDLLAQAETGLMSLTGEVDGPPQKTGVAVLDVLAGLNAALATVAKLFERERLAEAGRGGLVETSLFEAGLAGLINVASNYLVSGEAPKRHGNAHPNITPYAVFNTRDRPIVIAVGNDRQFAAFAEVLGREAWALGEFAGNAQRVAQRERLSRDIEAILTTRTFSEWLMRLRRAGVPCGPLARVDEVLEGDQAAARAMVQESEHSKLGKLRLVSAGFKLDGLKTMLRYPPPTLDEHGEALRAELEGEG
ncbi:MAG: CoA transferase [Deinococcota bacterium]|nr:CoA transferase [Deinococcota bacterium]